MSLRALLRHKVSIYRQTANGRSADGEELRTWSLIAAGVRTDLQLTQGTVMQQSEGRVALQRYPFTMLRGTDVQQDDGLLIEVADDDVDVGRRLRVRSRFGWRAGGVQGEVEDTQEDFG